MKKRLFCSLVARVIALSRARFWHLVVAEC